MAEATPNQLVLTAVGPDRPGLVRAISKLVHAAGASVEDSRMAILGGEFALIMLVSGAEASVARVEREVGGLEAELGLKLLLKRTRSEPPRPFLRREIRVTGVDRPGIVHAVTDLLAKREVNVASLESRVTFAPESGTPMFELAAELQVPSEITLGELGRELAELCQSESLELLLDTKA